MRIESGTDERTVARNVGPALVVIRGPQFVAESEFARQLLCPRLLCHPRIGAALNGEAICVDGFNDAAKATSRLEKVNSQVSAYHDEVCMPR